MGSYFWWEDADWVQDTFFCALTLYNTSAALKSPSHILLILRNLLFLQGRGHITWADVMTTSLQATAFWEGPWKISFMLCKMDAWALPRRDGSKNLGFCGSTSTAKGDSHAVGGHPTHWDVHTVASSPSFPTLPTHPKSSSTLVTLNYRCIFQ